MTASYNETARSTIISLCSQQQQSLSTGASPRRSNRPGRGANGGNSSSEDGVGMALLEKEKIGAIKDAAVACMQRDAAMAALTTMQELYGTPQDQIPLVSQLLEEQGRLAAITAAAELKGETVKLKVQLAKIRHAEAAQRETQREKILTLARACTQLCHAVCQPHDHGRSERESQRAVEGLRREVLALCDHVRRDLF